MSNPKSPQIYLRETELDSFLRVLRKPAVGTEEGNIGLVRELERSVEGTNAVAEFSLRVIDHIREAGGNFVEEVIPNHNHQAMRR